MKTRSLELSPRARANTEREFYRALLTLQSVDEASAFFADLCTPAELEALLDRWSVVGHLEDGLPYRRIHELTGVSVTTIGRVARFLTGANGGYRTALARLRPGDPATQASQDDD
jgi:TrpR-related protein YerC/YecD